MKKDQANKINVPSTVLGGSVKDTEKSPSTSTGSLHTCKPLDSKIDPKSQGGSVTEFSDSAPPKVTKFQPEVVSKPTTHEF